LRGKVHRDHPHDTYNLATGKAPTVHELIAMLCEIVPGAQLSPGGGQIKHPGGIDMPLKGALDVLRAAEVFGYRPRYDLRAGLELYTQAVRQRNK
jgi:nucleoside-diphosphate-sugar epimerase